MRSKVVLLLISFVVVKFVHSQSNELLIQGQTGGLYVEHTVVAKENWYSIGRLYNISPKEVAPYNKLTMAQPLNIGELLKIPLTAANFSQNGQKTPAETLIPLYHIIQEKEWMYRISVNHNKVPIGNLEKWNNISKDQVKAGMHLIVGFLKVKTALSALAKMNGAAVATAGPAAASRVTMPPAPKPVVATHPAATEQAGTDQFAKQDPPPVKEVNASPTNNAANTSANTPANTTPVNTPATVPAIHFNGGYFKTDYAEADKSASGLAGTFKSTSGWQDGKYYALMNNVAVGSIIKITVSSTNKSVYAKVLGQLPDMKESAGLTIRISNAAASELGEGEGRFSVEVKY